MKKIYLFEVTQHKTKHYVGKASARELVKLATKAELNAEQEAQRPINPKRLEEISSFVSNDGSLSTSIVFGTTNDNLSVHPVEGGSINNLFYMEFPETEDEYAQFKNSFDLLDGQHRLFSFLPEYIKISDDEDFEITFEMYLKPTMKQKRIIFKNTNEKQEKVPPNLLMWFREKLNMLSRKENTYHQVVTMLNKESCSPLKGRIIMGAEKITGGFKAQQVINILDKSDIAHIRPDDDDKDKADDAMLRMIPEYLSGWEDAVNTKIIDRDRDYGAFSKISGLRFMILMLPTFYAQAVNEKANFNKDHISSKIKKLFATKGISPEDIFYKDSNYLNAYGSNPYASETSITIFAKYWENELKKLSSDSFDPLG